MTHTAIPAVAVVAGNLNAIEQYCHSNNLTLIATHDAAGQLQQAIADACEHEAVLVAAALADVARTATDVILLGRRLCEAGAHLALIEQRIDTTRPGADAVFDLLAAMADLEYHRLADRLPFGYAVADDLEHIVIEPREAEVICHVVDWHHDGLSLTDIAARLNAQRIAPRRADKWTADAVRSVIDHAPTSRWEFIEEGNA